MDESNAVKLNRVIILAIEGAPGAEASDIVSTIVAKELPLIMDWAFDQVGIRVRKQIQKTAKLSQPPGPYQMFLQGFNDLLERLPLPRRGGIALAKATIVDLRNSLKMTRLKSREASQRTATLIEEMAPFAKTRRGLTVEAYLELRAAGVKATRKSLRKKHFDDED